MLSCFFLTSLHFSHLPFHCVFFQAVYSKPFETVTLKLERVKASHAEQRASSHRITPVCSPPSPPSRLLVSSRLTAAAQRDVAAEDPRQRKRPLERRR